MSQNRVMTEWLSDADMLQTQAMPCHRRVHDSSISCYCCYCCCHCTSLQLQRLVKHKRIIITIVIAIIITDETHQEGTCKSDTANCVTLLQLLWLQVFIVTLSCLVITQFNYAYVIHCNLISLVQHALVLVLFSRKKMVLPQLINGFVSLFLNII